MSVTDLILRGDVEDVLNEHPYSARLLKDVRDIPSRADLSPSPEVVKELVEALRTVVNALHDAEKTLTEELHSMDFCGESAPLCNARAVLAKLEGGE